MHLHSSALFGIFCGLMFMTQVHLIMLNQTTVESLAFRSMRDREQATLAHMHRWYDIGCVINLCLGYRVPFITPHLVHTVI